MRGEVLDREQDIFAVGSRPLSAKHPAVWQWNLRTLFLLTAAVAVWVAYLHFCYETPRLRQRIITMQEMARELVIEDEQQIAAVVPRPEWFGERQWDVYLPDGEFVLCLATREIPMIGLAPVARQAPISPGRHRIELIRYENNWGPHIKIVVDNQKCLEFEESEDWSSAKRSDGTNTFERGKQLPPDEPLILQRDRFMYPGPDGLLEWPGKTANGLMLWIEQSGTSESSRP